MDPDKFFRRIALPLKVAIRFFPVWCLFLWPILVTAQPFSSLFRKIEQVPFAHQQLLFSVLKDHEGYLWITSDKGLVRYDASRFTWYTGSDLISDKNQKAIPRVIFKDAYNGLHVITSQGKLLQYNHTDNRFQQVNDSTTLLGKSTRQVLTTGNNNLWVADLGSGLALFNASEKEIKWYKNEPGNERTIPDNFVTALTYDRDGTLWIATTSGLCRYDEESDSFERVPLKNQNPDDTYRYRVIRSLAYDSSAHRLFIGTYGGLHIMDMNTLSNDHFLHQPGQANTIAHNSIVYMLYDKRNDGLWIATYGGGLNFLKINNMTFSHWLSDPTDVHSLDSDNLIGLYLDDTGLLWIVPSDAPLHSFDTDKPFFRRLKNHSRNSLSMAKGYVNKVFAESDTVLWIGFSGSGLDKLNLYTGRTTHYLPQQGKPRSLPHHSVMSMDMDAEGKLWIALDGAGLAVYHSASNDFESIRFIPGKQGLLNDALSSVLVDEEKVWISAFRTPLTVYNRKTHKYTYFNRDSLNNLGISFDNVRKIKKLGDVILFEMIDGGVLYDKKKGTFSKVLVNGKPCHKIFGRPSDTKAGASVVYLYAISGNNEIYRGIYRNDIPEFELIYKGNDEYLSFYDLYADNAGNVWIAEENVIIRYNPATREELFFNENLGLDITALRAGFDYDRFDRVYLRSSNGITWFIPSETTHAGEERFEVRFTNLRIFNHDTHVNPNNKIVLKPRENFFSLTFSALYYNNPSAVHYRYRLKGFSDDWILNGNNNTISFANLPSGQYELEVQATVNSYKWQSNYASLRLEVLPPFWQTWWFIALMVLLVMVLATGIHRFRVNQKLKVERLRTKIASDLHDEVGAQLTRISLFSELLKNNITDSQKHDYLNNIRELSRNAISTMSDIIWSLDTRSDAIKDLALRMKEFAFQTLQPLEIDLIFKEWIEDENIQLSPVIKQNIYLIFKESIHNVIKHAKATQVNVYLKFQQENFSLIIQDNGKGITEENPEKGNGLRNMYSRAKIMNGNLSISGTGGTRVEFSMHLR